MGAAGHGMHGENCATWSWSRPRPLGSGQLEHSAGSTVVQGWSQSNVGFSWERLSLCTAPPASPCLRSALSFRSCRIWPPNTPTSSSSRSVGAPRCGSFAPVPLASAQAGHTLGAPCWEGAVPWAGACRAIGHCHLWVSRGDSSTGTQALTSLCWLCRSL